MTYGVLQEVRHDLPQAYLVAGHHDCSVRRVVDRPVRCDCPGVVDGVGDDASEINGRALERPALIETRKE